MLLHCNCDTTCRQTSTVASTIASTSARALAPQSLTLSSAGFRCPLGLHVCSNLVSLQSLVSAPNTPHKRHQHEERTGRGVVLAGATACVIAATSRWPCHRAVARRTSRFPDSCATTRGPPSRSRAGGERSVSPRHCCARMRSMCAIEFELHERHAARVLVPVPRVCVRSAAVDAVAQCTSPRSTRAAATVPVWLTFTLRGTTPAYGVSQGPPRPLCASFLPSSVSR